MGISLAEARRLGILRAPRSRSALRRLPEPEPEKRPKEIPPRQFEIELPLPSRLCSPNARSHWGPKHKATATYRAQCGMLIKSAMRGKKVYCPVQIDLDFYLADRGRGSFAPYDDDNAVGSFKAGRDALGDAGVVPRDTKRYVKTGDVRILSTKKEHENRACLVLRIIEL